MTSIPLTMSTVRDYMGGASYNPCRDISNIHVRHEGHSAKVVARIPASSTRQGHYDVEVSLRPNGRAILDSTCSCPVGYRCKHVYKVLCRIAAPEPIGGPDRHTLQREARRRRQAEQMEHASVYIALACKSEMDSGSDYRRSHFIKDNFDQKILGVFFSKTLANQCAKNMFGRSWVMTWEKMTMRRPLLLIHQTMERLETMTMAVPLTRFG